jgi:hypothetical protein
MRKLLVEGADDQHVLWALLQRRGVRETFSIDETGGYENLLKSLPVQLKASGLERIGVVIDADSDALARWQAVRAAYRRGGLTSFPANPIAGGLILNHNGLRVGAWLMPDNNLPGMLEDFVRYLVPEDDEIWPESSLFVDSLASTANRYRDCHAAKARVHAWLSVQDSPGSPMGQAITKRLLRHDGPECDAFMDWLQRLFVAD